MERLLSIIIPVYNVEKYLKLCIDSIISQNDEVIEILLIDDGSTDKSIEICNYYASRFENVICYHKINGGLSDARNYGIEKASGDYIMFVDSDDLIAAGSIKYIKKTLERKPDILRLSFCEFLSEENICESETTIIKESSYERGQEALADLIKKHRMQMCAPFSIIKHSIIKQNEMFMKGIIHEDELWTPQIYLSAGNVIVSSFVYYLYRKGHQSITGNNDKTKSSNDLIVVCDHLDSRYRNLKDRKNYKILNNYLCTLYLSGYVDWVLSGKKKMIQRYNRTFPIRHAFDVKNFLKSMTYLVSPNLYYFFYSIIRRKK